jgi:hypothetical protein
MPDDKIAFRPCSSACTMPKAPTEAAISGDICKPAPPPFAVLPVICKNGLRTPKLSPGIKHGSHPSWPQRVRYVSSEADIKTPSVCREPNLRRVKLEHAIPQNA